MSGFEGLRVLLAEDNRINSEMAKEILIEQGMMVDTVYNGAEAYAAVTKSPADTYDVILMDLKMPVLDGYEAAKKIRALSDERLSGIPIVALTSVNMGDGLSKAFACGMNGYVMKPIDPRRIMETLKNVLEK